MEPYLAIRPQGFDVEQFRQILGQSCLMDKLEFINATDNLLELIDGFVKLMDREEIGFGAVPLGTLHAAGIIMYMMYHNDLASTHFKRNLFLQRCFDYMACTEETHVHELCTQILCLLDINESNNMLNMISCCHNAASLSTMAQIVCSCLLWAMLDKLTDMGFDAYRLRAYSELMLCIALVNPLIYLQNNLHSLNLILRIMNALLTIGPYGATEKLRNELDVPQAMLEFTNEDAAVLFCWLNTIIEELSNQLQLKDGHVQERMIVLETACELMKLLHAHLTEFYQNQSLHCVRDADNVDDGFISDHQCDNDEDFEWLL